MSRTFTKLFSSITESTIWVADSHTRIVWITMLAMADHAGRVWGSVPGLANRARVTIAEAESALQLFLSPDTYSRTKDFEGRRIEVIDGGWRLLNHAKYRAIRDEESIKQSKRDYINKKRADARAASVENVDRSRHNADAYTEAEAEAVIQIPENSDLIVSSIILLHPRALKNTRTEQAVIQAIIREAKVLGSAKFAADYLLTRTRIYSECTHTWQAKEKRMICSADKWFNEGKYAEDEKFWRRGNAEATDAEIEEAKKLI